MKDQRMEEAKITLSTRGEIASGDEKSTLAMMKLLKNEKPEVFILRVLVFALRLRSG